MKQISFTANHTQHRTNIITTYKPPMTHIKMSTGSIYIHIYIVRSSKLGSQKMRMASKDKGLMNDASLANYTNQLKHVNSSLYMSTE